MTLEFVCFAVFAIPGAVILGWVIKTAPARRRALAAIEPIALTPLGALREGPARVLVGGTVIAGETFAHPLTGAEVVAWWLHIYYFETVSESEDRIVTVLDEREVRDFDIRDSTGSARVELSHPSICRGLETGTPVLVSTAGLPVALRGRFKRAPPSRLMMRCESIAPGPTIHVLGRAFATGTTAGAASYREATTTWALRYDDGDGAPMVLTDRGEEHLRKGELDVLRDRVMGPGRAGVLFGVSDVLTALGENASFPGR